MIKVNLGWFKDIKGLIKHIRAKIKVNLELLMDIKPKIKGNLALLKDI